VIIFSPLFIKPTAHDCEDYFYYELDGRIVPHPIITNSNTLERVNYTIETLNLNCLRLQRERGSMIREGLEIINYLSDYPDSLAFFIELELVENVNYKHRSFITTRQQYFQDLV